MTEVVRCIVLHTVKYGDNGLIIKCLTNEGLKTFFIAAYVRNNRNKYPFLSYPLSIAECHFFTAKGNSLPKVKSLTLDYVPRSASFDFRRQAIATFMAECALRYVREETAGPEVFDFLCKSIRFVDTSDYVNAAYPVQFGFGLASILGFGIAGFESPEKDLIFTLDKGFVPATAQAALNAADSEFLNTIVSSEVNEPAELRIPPLSLKNIFQTMLLYFRYHFPETQALKSPEILHLLME